MPPEPQPPTSSNAPGPVALPARSPVYPWYQKMWAFVFITFASVELSKKP